MNLTSFINKVMTCIASHDEMPVPREAFKRAEKLYDAGASPSEAAAIMMTEKRHGIDYREIYRDDEENQP